MSMLPAAIAIARHHVARADEDEVRRARRRERTTIEASAPIDLGPEYAAWSARCEAERERRRTFEGRVHMAVLGFFTLGPLALCAWSVVSRLAP
jgi:aspartate ammonia-lyase